MGEGTRKSRPSQRCDRRLRQQAGKNRLGGAAARRTVRRHRNAGGGIELGRSRSKRPTVNRGLREGNDGDGLTVERRFGSLVQKTARSDAGSFMRTGACVSPSWPEEAPRGRIR